MTLLRLENLSVRFATTDGALDAVRGIDLAIAPGECLGVVGESGSGKSQSFLAALGLLAENGAAHGKAMFGDRDLLTLSERQLNTVRGDKIAMVFQDPMTALTPHMTIGRQMVEVLTHHRGMKTAEARHAAAAMLKRVQVPDAERRLDMYPHALSGGLRQRVMIAMALLCGPALIIADEPTTALDVTVQAQILELFREIKNELNTAIALITHDLGVIAGIADRVAVMYAGRIVEIGTVHQIFHAPRHPYTQALLACTPTLAAGQTALYAIPGQPPNPQHLPAGCAFAPRCVHAIDACTQGVPPLRRVASGSDIACIRDVGSAQ
jgi:oligopeptide transport system ATP-binding protein